MSAVGDPDQGRAATSLGCGRAGARYASGPQMRSRQRRAAARARASALRPPLVDRARSSQKSEFLEAGGYR
jgi:hypothetical protein